MSKHEEKYKGIREPEITFADKGLYENTHEKRFYSFWLTTAMCYCFGFYSLKFYYTLFRECLFSTWQINKVTICQCKLSAQHETVDSS